MSSVTHVKVAILAAKAAKDLLQLLEQREYTFATNLISYIRGKLDEIEALIKAER